jgi:hypothetical protein
MLWRKEDNPTDKNASDMAVMMFDTATHKSDDPLNDTINPAHQIEAMMRQTPETDADEMIDEEEEVPDEEPPDDHANKKEGEMAPLDALYPKMRVSSNEKQQTLHRMSTMPESTYYEAVKNETFRENRSNTKIVEGEIVSLDALYPMIRGLTDYERQKTVLRMSTMHVSTYKEDVMTETYTEDVKDKANMENIDVPRTVANTSSIDYGSEDPKNTYVTGETGTKEDTKRLAVTAITSERGDGGA